MIQALKVIMLICPKCGSTDVEIDDSVIIGMFPESYICNKCKNMSSFFPDVDKKDVETFRKGLAKT